MSARIRTNTTCYKQRNEQDFVITTVECNLDWS